MELHLSDGWYLINPRQIRSVKYFLAASRFGRVERYYSPDTKIEEIPNHEEMNFQRIVSIEIIRQKENEIIDINVNDDKTYNYIRSKLGRKFGLSQQKDKKENTTNQ